MKMCSYHWKGVIGQLLFVISLCSFIHLGLQVELIGKFIASADSTDYREPSDHQCVQTVHDPIGV